MKKVVALLLLLAAAVGVNGGTFSYGSNTLADPQFVSPAIPAQPACTTSVLVTACMASVISNFTAQAGGAAGKGYQPPGPCAPNADFPTFWAMNVNACNGVTSPNVSVMSFNANFPNQSSAKWIMPALPSFVLGQQCTVPVFLLGQQFGGNTNGQAIPAGAQTPTPFVVSGASEFSTEWDLKPYDLSTVDGGYDSIFIEIYNALAPGRPVSLSREFSIYLHTQPSTYAYWGQSGSCNVPAGCTIRGTYTSACFTGDMTLDTSQTSGGATGGRIFVFPTAAADKLSSAGCKLDIKDVMARAVTLGMMPSGTYINGVELLAEVGANSGYLILNCWAVNWNGTPYGNCGTITAALVNDRGQVFALFGIFVMLYGARGRR